MLSLCAAFIDIPKLVQFSPKCWNGPLSISNTIHVTLWWISCARYVIEKNPLLAFTELQLLFSLPRIIALDQVNGILALSLPPDFIMKIHADNRALCLSNYCLYTRITVVCKHTHV
jgi:hypothetical protein